jgi:hypothetical protein
MTRYLIEHYDEAWALPMYLKKNYPRFFSHDEWRAIQVLVFRAKIAWSENPEQPPLHYAEALAEEETPQALALLAEGETEFWRRASERILRAHGPSIIINRCQRCTCIVASPTARQCLWCHYDWHATRES